MVGVSGVYSYAVVTDPTLWSDVNWCGDYQLTSGAGRPLLANGAKSFLLHVGSRYNIRTRQVRGSVSICLVCKPLY